MEPISNTASNTVTQREADRDLLRILEGQNHMLAREQSRLFFSNVILAIVVAAMAAWVTWRLDRVESMILEQTSLMQQTKKQAWELKTAFGLKFSQERSADAKPETEMP